MQNSSIIFAILNSTILAVTLQSPIQSSELESSHTLSLESGIGLEQSGLQVLELNWQPELTWSFEHGGELVTIARLRFQPQTGIRPSELQREAYNHHYDNGTRPILLNDHSEFEIREFYYQQSYADWFLRIGKQQVVWGKTDGLKVLDVVNPQSFREFILEDFEDSRIPLWMANIEHPIGDDWIVQVLWIPDHTYHVLPESGASYSFSSPRFVTTTKPGVIVNVLALEHPEHFWKDSDFGLRLTGFIAGWDLSLNYLYQYQNFSVLVQKLIPAQQSGVNPMVEVQPEYYRSHILGGSISRAFGEWVVRGELGWFSHRYVLNPNKLNGLSKTAELKYVFGLDYSGFNYFDLFGAQENVFLSLQIFQSYLNDYKKSIVRPELDTNLTFLWRQNFYHETLSSQILWILNTNDGDGLIRPKITYEYNDNIQIWSGLDIFYGHKKGQFGQFKSNDRWIWGIEYSF